MSTFYLNSLLFWLLCWKNYCRDNEMERYEILQRTSRCFNLLYSMPRWLSASWSLWMLFVTHHTSECLLDNNSCSMNIIIRTAVGCSNLVPPDDAWLKRSGDELIIGCYSSRQTWQLRCERRRWIGVLSNCTAGRIHRFTLLSVKIDEIYFSRQNYSPDLYLYRFCSLKICLLLMFDFCFIEIYLSFVYDGLCYKH